MIRQKKSDYERKKGRKFTKYEVTIAIRTNYRSAPSLILVLPQNVLGHTPRSFSLKPTGVLQINLH
jgi:hypothetical protein